MWQYVQIGAVFVAAVLLARIVDEIVIRWRQRKRDETDDQKK